MVSQRALVPVLVTGMLLTGCSNTLLTKYQDNQCVRDCDPNDPSKGVGFEQPVIQTLQMFIGEMGCWLVLGLYNLFNHIQSRRNGTPASDSDYTAVASSEETVDEEIATPSSPLLKALVAKKDHPQLSGIKILLLALPAVCDICGTTLMNVGLLFVVASVYQMTRGALVLFVGLFSVVFLKRHLFAFQWGALVIVVLGVGIVGLAGALFKSLEAQAVLHTVMDTDANVLKSIVGVLLIAGAQIFTATQFVLEEYILEKYAMEPLQVVGWEGIFGFSFTVIGMTVLHFAIGATPKGQYGYFDAVEGLRELGNFQVLISSFCIMVSIGAFNFFGISVTRTVSATSRSTIDTCRTLFIWLVSMGLGWETFKWLQVVGFGLLVYGTFLFNQIISPPLAACNPNRPVEELLPEEPIEHM